jgi:hypothetical protein
LLVHANVDDADIRYISTSNTATTEKNNACYFSFTNLRLH